MPRVLEFTPRTKELEKYRKISVTSATFSRHAQLVSELRATFPSAIIQLNSEGRQLSGVDLYEFLSDSDAAIVGLERISRELLDSLDKLKSISKFGVGLDNIDTGRCSELGIHLGWTGGVNRRSVSELSLAFLLGLSRNVFFSGYSLKSGTWNKNGGRTLSGRTVGIVGFGFIGEDLARLLQPFHCKLLVADIVDKSFVAPLYGGKQVSLEELLRGSDFVTLHVPLTELTRTIINSHTLSLMRSDAFLINTARGPLVNEEDLKNALKIGAGLAEGKGIAGAALDVFNMEPPEDAELLALPNLMVTPHIGGNAAEAVLAMGQSAIFGLSKIA
ncbi:hypothetical protein CH373_12140 [Leptospira perolatii]|uniref:Hydroxyacid dehydrogenase n=2 Tax=Leptospira perolatii TaxID=2023191 RepID=A0A2M9ZLG7_9LEPT|nr:phosphoglycerate dehydrogenase [Leptospira perolatii]PJZ70385.1 hypothetical protein CH360_06830 [Leptospira perolatii]PJZ72932.1 hypothetical protein CH373_12140 [Leptospira perolatii]